MNDRILKFADSKQYLGKIARSGENNTRSLAFDCSTVLTEYPAAQIIAVIQRPQGDPYTVTPDADGTIRQITLTSYDLEYNGHLQVELRVLDGDKILKSAIYTATVDDSIRGEADAPGQPVRDVLDRLEAEIKQAQAVVYDIRQKLENGEFNGSDANVTAENIQSALGYVPEKKVLRAETDTAILGEELAFQDGWTLGTGWSGDFLNGFSHSSGTDVLVFNMQESTKAQYYQISFKSSELMTDHNLFVSVGDSPSFNLYFEEHEDGTISVGVLAANDGNLTFTPSTDYRGTISDISIRRVLGAFTPIKQLFDTYGDVTAEIYVTPQKQDNLYVGLNAGRMNTTGNRNVALGANALKTNLSGWRNIAIGSGALRNNTAGTRNIAIGEDSIPVMQTGQRNIAIGSSTMVLIVNGNRNIAIGADSMLHAEECDDCIAIGFASLNMNKGSTNYGIGTRALYSTTGGKNIAIGYDAGNGLTIGSENVLIGGAAGYNLKTGKNNVAIGPYAAKGANNSDQSHYNVAIGYCAAQNIARYSSYNVVIGANVAASLGGADHCIVIGAGQDIDANENYQLNIGGLIGGSMQPGAAFLKINGDLELPTIPTSDPQSAGRVWNDKGTLKISEGN